MKYIVLFTALFLFSISICFSADDNRNHFSDYSSVFILKAFSFSQAISTQASELTVTLTMTE